MSNGNGGIQNTQKAYIQELDNNYAPIGEKIHCLFNPEKYTIIKKNIWKKAKTGGSNSDGGKEGKSEGSGDGKGKKHSDSPQLDFGGGGPQKLKVKLFFDTTSPEIFRNNGNKIEDVNKYTGKVFGLMKISGETPPLCHFSWGSYISPPSVVMSISQKFLMFQREGIPIRAELTVTFQEQHQEKKGTNPTSVGTARRTWVVRGGDRLDLIAFHELGDATRWSDIAKMNNLLNPLDLKAGQILRIPLK